MNSRLLRNGYWIAAVSSFSVLYGLFLLVSYPEWHKYQQLHETGRETIGTILGKNIARHRSIQYSYTVDTLTFSGTANASLARLPFEQMRDGDHVPITYLPNHPEISVAGDATTLYLSWSRLLFVFAPCICLALSVPLAVLLWAITRTLRIPESVPKK